MRPVAWACSLLAGWGYRWAQGGPSPVDGTGIGGEKHQRARTCEAMPSPIYAQPRGTLGGAFGIAAVCGWLQLAMGCGLLKVLVRGEACQLQPRPAKLAEGDAAGMPVEYGEGRVVVAAVGP